MYDVIVIGAGPSGLNAARKLSEGGLDVLVLERKSEIGKPVVCTGIVGKAAFKEFDLSRDSILKEIKKIKVVSPLINSLSYEHPQPFACVVNREKFDQYLACDAQKNGAEISLGHEVVDISVEKDHVEVLTSRREKHHEKVKSQIVLISTGINYNLHKKIGLGYPTDFINGAQIEIESEDVDCTTVFLGNDVAPGAFAWHVPVDGKTVRIGLLTEKNPERYFEHFMDRFYPGRMKDLDKSKIQYKVIAQGLVSRTYGERVLAVGEAAGQVKTTSGGGIYFGLLCSEIASKIVIEKFKEGNFTSRDLSEYEKAWRQAVEKEITVGYYARKLIGKLNDYQIERMFQFAQNDGVIPLLKDKGDFDWQSSLIPELLKRMPFIRNGRKEGAV